MVRAIAFFALVEAARHGEYCATFHGFRVQAIRRGPAPEADAGVEINLTVSLGKHLVERGVATAGDADGTEPCA